MNKKYGIAVLCGVALVTSALISSRQAESGKQTEPRVATQANAPAVSEKVYYSHLFHHIAFLNKKAADDVRRGKNGNALRTLYRRQVELSDAESRALNEISSDCVRKVALQDEKAKRIIDQFRARYPGGKVPQGEQLPPPPPQLQAMQEERNQIILRARDRLRTALGDQTFSRVDGFVKRTITINNESTFANLATSANTTHRLKQRVLP